MWHSGTIHPGEREAERLRTIITALAEAMPGMELGIAKDVIFASEKKAAELERQQVAPEVRNVIELPSRDPQFVKQLIGMQPHIMDNITGGKKINAIKDLRALVTVDGMALGLKEAKDAVEAWESDWRYPAATGTASAAAHSVCPPSSIPHPGATTAAFVDWLQTEPMLHRIYDDSPSGGKIKLIKEVRSVTTLGLKEAKDVVDEWVAAYRPT